jgi:hypothetical protein
VLDYELQQTIINDHFEKEQSQGAIFDIHREEVKLIEGVDKKLRL